MLNCLHCGKPVPNGQRMCPSCGFVVGPTGMGPSPGWGVALALLLLPMLVMGAFACCDAAFFVGGSASGQTGARTALFLAEMVCIIAAFAAFLVICVRAVRVGPASPAGDGFRARLARLPVMALVAVVIVGLAGTGWLASVRIRVWAPAPAPIYQSPPVIRRVPPKVGKALGPNMVPPANQKAGWVLETDTDSRAKASWKPSGPGEAQFTVSRVASHVWDVQWLRKGLTLTNGRWYVAQFTARADRARPVDVHTQRDIPGYQTIGLLEQAPLTTQWQTFRFPFQATDALPRHGALQFELGQASGTVWLRDISLVPVEAPR